MTNTLAGPTLNSDESAPPKTLSTNHRPEGHTHQTHTHTLFPLLYNERIPALRSGMGVSQFCQRLELQMPAIWQVGYAGTQMVSQYRGIEKNEQTFLCYWWYSILVLVFFKLFYFIGAVPPKSPFYLGVPPKPPFYWGVPPQTPQLYNSTNYHLVNRTIEYRKSIPALRSGMGVSPFCQPL